MMRPLQLMFVLLALCTVLMPALAAEAEALRPDDIWFYAGFDGTLKPTLAPHLRQIKYQQWSTREPLRRRGQQPSFTDGLTGRGFYIGGPDGQRPGDSLSYVFDVREFPVKAGTVAFWFKPKRPLHAHRGFLYELHWAAFDAHMNGKRLIAYATGSPRDLVKATLPGFELGWEDRWHLFTLTWQGERVDLYMDGKRVGGSDGVTPLRNIGSTLTLGSLPPSEPAGPRSVPVGYIESTYDEFVILKRPLSSVQIEKLYQLGTAEKPAGFLELLDVAAILQMPRAALLRGEQATVEVRPLGAPDAAQLVLRTQEGEAVHELELPRRKPSRTVFNTANLRPGKYHVHLLAQKGGRQVYESAPHRLVVQAGRRPPFPLGLGAHLGSDEKTLALYEKMHISLLSSNGPHLPSFRADLDRAFAHGICLFPNLNILEVWQPGYEAYKEPPYFLRAPDGRMRVNRDWTYRYLQTLVWADGSPDDHRTTSSASPFSPIAFRMMKRILDDLMVEAGDHPGLLAMSFQDEVPLRMSLDKEKKRLKVGDYSYYAVEHYKNVTGRKNAAFPPDDPPGTVWPEDHPYLLWMRNIGVPGDATAVGLDRIYEKLTAEVKRHRKDVTTTNYSGAEFGLCDVVLDWRYPTIWSPNPWDSARGGAYLDYIFDRHWSRQWARPRKPLWALLGWWSGDMSTQPDWCVADLRLNTAWAVAKGCKLIMWFAPGRGPLTGPDSGPFSRPDLRRELKAHAAWLHRHGPMLARLEKRPYRRTALLWSRTDRAGKIRKQMWAPEYHLVFGGLRNAGAEPDFVTDRMIREGALDDYEALVLCDFDYSSEDLWRRIKTFAGTRGKHVFHDTASDLVPPGSIPLEAPWHEEFRKPGEKRHNALVRTDAVATWARRLRKIVRPKLNSPDIEIKGGSGYLSANILWAGRTRYLFVINIDMLRPHSGVVWYRSQRSVVYSIKGPPQLKLNRADALTTFQVTLEPGDWHLYVLPAAAKERVDLRAKFRAGVIDVTATLQAANGNRLDAAAPLLVQVYDPEGNETSYSRYAATDASGRWSARIEPAPWTDRTGRWTVRVTDWLTGDYAHESVHVDVDAIPPAKQKVRVDTE